MTSRRLPHTEEVLHDAIHAQRNPAMGRCSRRQRLEEKAELPVDLLGPSPRIPRTVRCSDGSWIRRLPDPSSDPLYTRSYAMPRTERGSLSRRSRLRGAGERRGGDSRRAPHPLPRRGGSRDPEPGMLPYLRKLHGVDDRSPGRRERRRGHPVRPGRHEEKVAFLRPCALPVHFLHPAGEGPAPSVGAPLRPEEPRGAGGLLRLLLDGLDLAAGEAGSIDDPEAPDPSPFSTAPFRIRSRR
jgi:hypothetical protein